MGDGYEIVPILVGWPLVIAWLVGLALGHVGGAVTSARRDADEIRQLVAGQARARKALSVLGVVLGGLVLGATVLTGAMFPGGHGLAWFGVLSIGCVPVALVVLLAGVLRGKTAALRRGLATRQAVGAANADARTT